MPICRHQRAIADDTCAAEGGKRAQASTRHKAGIKQASRRHEANIKSVRSS
jgi:hypothetical protein